MRLDRKICLIFCRIPRRLSIFNDICKRGQDFFNRLWKLIENRCCSTFSIFILNVTKSFKRWLHEIAIFPFGNFLNFIISWCYFNYWTMCTRVRNYGIESYILLKKFMHVTISQDYWITYLKCNIKFCCFRSVNESVF